MAHDEAQRRDVWETRKYLSVNLKALHPLKLSEDVVVPRSRIPEMVGARARSGRGTASLVATYGHAGDGNLHATCSSTGEEERPRVEAAVGEILRAAVDLGGTITGEHGVGLAKRDYLAYEQGAELLALQRRLKAVFDPLGILNPGKMFPNPDGRRAEDPGSRGISRQVPPLGAWHLALTRLPIRHQGTPLGTTGRTYEPCRGPSARGPAQGDEDDMQPNTGKTRPVEQVDSVTIRFVGDSGDGMQLTGTEFTRPRRWPATTSPPSPTSRPRSAPRPARWPASPASRSTSARGTSTPRVTSPTCSWP